MAKVRECMLSQSRLNTPHLGVNRKQSNSSLLAQFPRQTAHTVGQSYSIARNRAHATAAKESRLDRVAAALGMLLVLAVAAWGV